MDGILSVIKPPGITSHDVVGMLRRILHEKRIGHGGTLDPLAMGILPIYVGKATRLIEYSAYKEKTYIAEGCFGKATDTEDISGNILKEEEGIAIPLSTLQDICQSFVGKSMQRPSSYSAIKINGQRAYELARKGELVELPERPVEIFECELLAYNYPFFTVRVRCSGGTYIRALLRDIFEKAGQIGTMTSLLRSAVGPYTLESSVTIEEIETLQEQALLPVEQAVSDMPVMNLSLENAQALFQGKRLSRREHSYAEGEYALFSEGRFLGISEVVPEAVKAKKMLFTPEP